MSASGAKRGCDGARTRAAVRSLVVLGTLALTSGAAAETWRGLEVAPEHRCSPYDKKADYPYPQSVERDIVHELGTVYGPYTGTCFGSTRDTDIEHIVAASEAHDSGLCARGQTDPSEIRPGPPEPHPRVPDSEPPPEVRQGCRRMAPGPKPVLVRSARARRETSVRPHRRPARGRRARANSLPVCKHRDGAARVPNSASVNRGYHPGPERRGRRTRALRRQPQRPDHMQGGAPAWDRARPPLAPRLSAHARRRPRRRRVRMTAPNVACSLPKPAQASTHPARAASRAYNQLERRGTIGVAPHALENPMSRPDGFYLYKDQLSREGASPGHQRHERMADDRARKKRPRRLVVRTPDFQSGNGSSILLGDAIQ